VGLFALPAGIIAQGYFEIMKKRPEQPSSDTADACPHCGEPLVS
jgi:hypothetical protein